MYKLQFNLELSTFCSTAISNILIMTNDYSFYLIDEFSKFIIHVQRL